MQFDHETIKCIINAKDVVLHPFCAESSMYEKDTPILFTSELPEDKRLKL